MATVNSYLYFNGNCEEAFNFYKSAFGKDFKHVGRYKDVPQPDRSNFRDADNKIMHISLPISKETQLMGCDNAELYKKDPVSINKFALLIHTDTREEADKLFEGLSFEGRITLPMTETFWGSYYGIFTDKFDINWKISFDLTGEIGS